MLKASCPQGALHEILQIVSRGVSGRSTQPVQNHVFLAADGGRLRLVATDLEYISLDAQVPALVLEEGQVTVPGRIFNEIVAGLPGEEVALEAAVDGKIVIRCGKAKYDVRGLPAQDFQMLPEVVPDAEFSVAENDLHAVLRQTVFACSPDETRPILTGALFEVRADQLIVVATDTYRLAQRTLPCAGGPEGGRKVIVSARVLNELMRILEADSSDPVTVRLSERLVEFSVRSLKIASRLIEGEYPNYEKVIPTEQDKTVTVSREALERALRRALIVGREDAYRVVLRGEDSVLRISASAAEIGQAEEEVDMQLTGEPVEIAFNGRYILDMLDAAGSDEVRISLSGPLNPGTLRAADREDYLYVLMPMQIMT